MLVRILLFLTAAVLSLTAQEYSTTTPDDLNLKKVVPQALGRIDLKESEVRIPVELFTNQFIRLPQVSRILSNPLPYIYKTENIARGALSVNGKATSILSNYGIPQVSPADFFEEAKIFLNRGINIYSNLIEVYGLDTLLSLTGEGKPLVDSQAFGDFAGFPRYRSFLRREAEHYSNARFFKDIDNEFKKLKVPSLFPTLDTNWEDQSLRELLTNLFKNCHIINGSTGDDTHIIDGSNYIIFEPGGSDLYRVTERRKAGRILIIIDSEGDDIYKSVNQGLGFSIFGLSLIVDKNGNDIYQTGDSTMASSFGGISVFYDLGGSDYYQSGRYSQSYSFMGFSFFYDASGSDRYFIPGYGQGMGAAGGISIMFDGNGDDLYSAKGGQADGLRYTGRSISFAQGAAYGVRPHAWGGVGMLIDGSGNDQYIGELFCQAAAYWPGVGALIDFDGHDTYQAQQYVQASGIHFGMGLLMDIKGNDRYQSHTVSAGCGHDLAIGFLYDGEGNDKTECFDLAGGAGSVNGQGFYFDLSGRDRYHADRAKNTFGYGQILRGFFSAGIFWDHGDTNNSLGDDLYNGKVQRESWAKGSFSLGADLPFNGSNTFSGVIITNKLSSIEAEYTNFIFSPVSVSNRAKEQFLISVSPVFSEKEKREAAIKKLSENQNLYLNTAISFIDNHDPALTPGIGQLLRKFEPAQVVNAFASEFYIKDKLGDPKRFYRNLFYILSLQCDPLFRETVLDFVGKIPDAQKPGGLYALAKLGGVTSKEWPPIKKYLKHKNRFVRKNSYLAFIPEKSKEFKQVKQALSTEPAIVRDAIVLRLLGEDITVDIDGGNPSLHALLAGKDKIPANLYGGKQIIEGYRDFIRGYFHYAYLAHKNIETE